HRAGTEINVFIEKFLDELAETVRLGKPGDLIPEFEILEDVLHVWRKAVEVGHEIVLKGLLRLARLEIAQEEGGGVVKSFTRGGAKGVVLIRDLFAVERSLHIEHGLFRGLQHGIEAAQDGHRQNDIAVFAAHKDVAKGIVGDAPDEAGDPVELGLVHVLVYVANESGLVLISWCLSRGDSAKFPECTDLATSDRNRKRGS
ncbi:MAG: hypothetical protein JWM99_4173, partial [Verrucomicrobiales bacterium]|nr:hypothetical protein [Verrucomicrobiales bacterium]